MSTSRITAIYRHMTGSATYAARFEIPRIKTNGVDAFPPETEAALKAGLVRQLREQASAFHHAAHLDALGSENVQCRVLAFYCDQRAKALFEYFSNPLPVKS